MRRRVARFLIITLVLGAAANVAVAWGCALLIDVAAGGSTVGASWEAPRSEWHLFRWERPGALLVVSRRTSYDEDTLVFYGDLTPIRLLPLWSGFEKTLTTPRSRAARQTTDMCDGRGWPLLSMWCEPARSEIPLGSQGVVSLPGRGMLPTALPAWSNSFFGPVPRVLPLRPIWKGFLLDTLLYGAAIALLMLGPPAARRLFRRRSAACMKCGYPRGTLGRCPECGTPYDQPAPQRLESPP